MVELVDGLNDQADRHPDRAGNQCEQRRQREPALAAHGVKKPAIRQIDQRHRVGDDNTLGPARSGGPDGEPRPDRLARRGELGDRRRKGIVVLRRKYWSRPLARAKRRCQRATVRLRPTLSVLPTFRPLPRKMDIRLARRWCCLAAGRIVGSEVRRSRHHPLRKSFTSAAGVRIAPASRRRSLAALPTRTARRSRAPPA